MYVLKSSGHSVCWVCGRKWSLKAFLADLLQISFSQASELCRGVAFLDQRGPKTEKLTLELPNEATGSLVNQELSDDDFEDPKKNDPAQDYKPAYLDASFIDVWRAENPEGLEYLIKRGITDPAAWVRHQIKYHAGMRAVVVPVIMFGIEIGYQARFIEPVNPKFRMRTSSGLPRDKALMGFDQAQNAQAVVVAEGIFDFLKADRCQEDVAAIATMGKVVTKRQIELIEGLPAKEIYLALDRDAADLIGEIAEGLKNKEVFRLLPPDHRGDLGECQPEEIIEAIKSAPRIWPQKTSRIELDI